MNEENWNVDAKLNNDGSYPADLIYLARTKVREFPRIQYGNLAHILKSSMIHLAKDGKGSKNMVINWSDVITDKKI